MGRHPIELTEAQKAEVETLAAVLTAEQVADYFGIGRRTFYAMMQRDEEIAARFKRGKAKAIGVIAQGLINKARNGDTTSMNFFLKTQAGWRETSQIEHMLPHDRVEAADDGFRKLVAYLDDVALRTRPQSPVEEATPAAPPLEAHCEATVARFPDMKP